MEIKTFYKSIQADLKKVSNTVDDLSAKSNSSTTTVKSIQDNTEHLLSESEIAKQNLVMIQKRFDMLDQQKKEISISPIQPEPVIQTLEIENI